MVVVTSDHGDVIEEHPPYWNHQLTVFEAVAHVPLIVRYPSAFEPGTRVRRSRRRMTWWPRSTT